MPAKAGWLALRVATFSPTRHAIHERRTPCGVVRIGSVVCWRLVQVRERDGLF